MTASRSLKFDGHWGGEIGVGYVRNCSFLDLSINYGEYWDRGRPKKQLQNDTAEIFQLPGNDWMSGRSVRAIRYGHVDLKGGQSVWRSGLVELEVFARARYINLQYVLMIQARNEDEGEFGSVNQKAKFEAAGPGIGLGGKVCWFEGFQWVGEMSLMGLVGEQSEPKFVVASNLQDPIRRSVSFRRRTVFAPGAYGQFGFSWIWDWECWRLVWDLGGEWLYYWNALRYVRSFEPGTTVRPCEGIGFVGFYAQLKVQF